MRFGFVAGAGSGVVAACCFVSLKPNTAKDKYNPNPFLSPIKSNPHPILLTIKHRPTKHKKDYADLIAEVKAEFVPPGGRDVAVVAFGGSYGGMLAAWMRLK